MRTLLQHFRAFLRPIEEFLFVPLSVHLTRIAWLSLGSFIITYIAFQKKLLGHHLTSLVAKVLFWPTFPITAAIRLGNFWTPIDDTVILGCAPMGFLNHPAKLHKLGVRGVVNMCDEYCGPLAGYETYGIAQLRLNTVDHYESNLKQLVAGVEFIRDYQLRGEKVYIHCKAGHGE
jgi:atypical dual specificity phosphatase